MKKFFAIAVIAIAFVACNNDAEKKDTPVDSTVTEAPATDSTVAPAVDTTAAPAMDTTTKM